MNQWREMTLGEALEVHHGFAFRGEHFREDGDLIVLTPGNFFDEGGFKPKSGKEKYYDGTFPPKFLLKAGDVVVAMTEQAEGLLGSTATIPEDGRYLHNQRIGLLEITDPDKLNLRFVYHLMNASSVRRQLQATATGAKVRHTAPRRIKQVRAAVPGVEIQEKAAGILDSLDGLIENSQQRVEVLEEMVREIYREWFVRLRHPGHQNTSFVDSALGLIPEGWEVRPLEEVAALVRGRSYRKQELVTDGGIPFINLKCMMRGGGFRRDGLKRYDGKYNAEQLVAHGDIVLAVTDLTQGREILARATLVPPLGEGSAVISLDVAKIVPNNPADRLWIFAALRWSDFADRVKEYANGSTVLHLSRGHVTDGLILWPGRDLRTMFTEMLSPTLASIDALNDSGARLADMRKMLLPKLVTGQIDVSSLDLEALVEEAVA